MTAQTYSIKRKLSLLQLADELWQRAKPARSWTSTATPTPSTEVCCAFQTGGVAALVESKRAREARAPTAWRPSV